MNVFYISVKLQRKKRGRGQHSDPVEAGWLSWYAHNHTAQAEEGCFKACLRIRGIFTEKKKKKKYRRVHFPVTKNGLILCPKQGSG